MPYALLFIGAVMLVAGIRNSQGDLWTLIQGDFVGGFLAWVAAIAIIGGLGYIPKLRPLSIAFMTLLLLVLVLSHSGVFAQLQQFIQSGAGASASGGAPNASQPAVTQPLPSLPSLDLAPEAQVQQNIQGIV
jgi:hypothetical protein